MKKNDNSIYKNYGQDIVSWNVVSKFIILIEWTRKLCFPAILPRNRAKLQRKLLVCQQTVLFFSGFLLWPANVWLHLGDLYWSTKLTQRCTFQLVWLDINWRFSRHIGKEQKMIQKLGWPILAWLRLRCMQKLGYFLA